MNNPANMYNSGNQSSSANDPQAMNSDLSQLSSTQSNYINQFVGSTPQSSYPQAPNTTVPQQPVNQPVQQPQVNLSMNQSLNPYQKQVTPAMDPVQQTPMSYDQNPAVPSIEPISSPQIQTPQLSNDYLYQEPVNNSLQAEPQNLADQFNTPTQVSNDFQMPQPIISDQLTSNYSSIEPQSQPNQPSALMEPQGSPVEQNYNPMGDSTSMTNQTYGNIEPQTSLNQTQFDTAVPQRYSPAVQQYPQPSQDALLANTPQQAVIEPQVIGAQQVEVNQDYSERFSNNQWLNTPLNPANQMQARTQMTPPQFNPAFQSPTTNLMVDHDFSDGSFGDDTTLSTGLLPAFDDTSDDSMLPVVSDDEEDDVFGNLDEPDASLPFGFSDYDPNEQISSSSDSLSGFETQSLEEEANRIDVDFSEAMPSNSQTIGVQTLEPQVASVTQMPQQTFTNQTASTVNYAAAAPTTLHQIEPKAEQTAVPLDSELSPTARLNKLLEEEEKAEKVIMQKQEQSVMKVAKAPKVVEAKSNIFKQTNDDVAFQGDIRNGMSTQKPTSRYFMIISMIIIISVIGFLLVLLGLTLL
jgi:hypothetical protein